jgi:hypothetical protein
MNPALNEHGSAKFAKTTPPNPKNRGSQVHPTARSLTLQRPTINAIRHCIRTKVLAPAHFGKINSSAVPRGTRPPKSGSADRKGTEPKLSWPIRRDTAKVLPMPTTTAAVSQNSRKTTHPNPKNSERQVHPTARSLTLRRLTINPIRLCIQTKVLAPGHFGKAPLNPAPGTPQTAELCKLKLRITAIPNPHSAQSYHR